MAERETRLLVVEDDPGMRDFYGRFFGRLLAGEFLAVIVANGERALDVLNCEPVDLVLIDWNLPGISGETLIRALRAHPKTCGIGVMMVTGRTSPEDELTSLNSGADDHIVKPFDEQELLARLRSLSRRLKRP